MTPTDEQRAAEEIHGVLLRYSRGVDRKDWEAVRACYHTDAIDDHGDYKGDIDGFVAWAAERNATMPQSMHFIGNVLIELTDERTAVAESYCLVMKAAAPGSGEQLSLSGIRYVDRFERRQGEGWRIAERTVTWEFGGLIGSEPQDGRPGPFVVARRDADDELWRARSAAGLGGPPHDEPAG